MTDEVDEVVKVLYDYSYSDDSGQVDIKAGDIYRLVEKTNSEWWQVYDPSDADGESFFVPAQYVKIVSDESAYKAISDLDKILTFGDATVGNETESDPYSSASDATQKLAVHIEDGEADYVNTTSQGDGDNGEYVNLDSYRIAAGIPNAAPGGHSGTTPPANYVKPQVPQALIQGTVPPPMPEEGTFIQELLKDLPWDIYKEHTAGRLYYVNRETGERMWKPPRKSKPSSEPPKTLPLNTTPYAAGESTQSQKKETKSVIPADYETVHDNGSVYFIHKSTQEKWKSLVDKVGRQYFHKLGSPDTQWTLPTSPVTSEKDIISRTSEQVVTPRLRQRDVNWESQGHRLSTFGGQSMRVNKTMSTYGQLETTGNRSSTLPANFTVARPAPVANDRSPTLTPGLPKNANLPSPGSGPPQIQEDVLEGYLNKAKIVEMGKKKVKKNWNQIYVVLQGSNLVFYKDQKSAPRKPDSPRGGGRTEGVLSLQGAHVDFNPAKEITSKKNTILLTVSSGTQFLFQSDNEKTIREWFTRMKIVANDVSPALDSSPKEFDFREDRKDEKKFEKGMVRSISADDNGVDRKNMVGIKAKLLGLISRRPTQEDLYKRGIIKDAVFGSRLHELCDKEKVHVPKFVHACIAAVEHRGLMHDGLYRISGNMAEIHRLRCAVDKDDSYNLYDTQWDVHVLTGSLKLFFRELKEPVFPFHMYNKFLDAIKKDLRKEKLSAFKACVSELPRCNYHTLKELFQHLCRITEKSHENRMQPQNVAIVFGPTLLWQEDDAGSLAVHTVYQSKIVEFILLEYHELFK